MKHSRLAAALKKISVISYVINKDMNHKLYWKAVKDNKTVEWQSDIATGDVIGWIRCYSQDDVEGFEQSMKESGGMADGFYGFRPDTIRETVEWIN